MKLGAKTGLMDSAPHSQHFPLPTLIQPVLAASISPRLKTGVSSGGNCMDLRNKFNTF